MMTVLKTILGHLRGLRVGYKYRSNWLLSTMNLQVGPSRRTIPAKRTLSGHQQAKESQQENKNADLVCTVAFRDPGGGGGSLLQPEPLCHNQMVPTATRPGFCENREHPYHNQQLRL